jgi:hypothetical protein
MLEGIVKTYVDFDLKEYDEAHAGKIIRLLQNPSREFRNAYVRSSTAYGSPEWLDLLMSVLGVENVAQVEAIIGPLDMEVTIWLFCGLLDEYDEATQKFGVVVRAFLFEVWDRYVRDQIKKHASR